MKFTNGFWLLRDDFTADYVRDIYCVEETDTDVRFFGPYRKIEGRGDVLNIGMMTFTVTAPMEDVLGIRMTNHAGNYVKTPAFALGGTPGRKCKVQNRDGWEFTSGKLALKIETGSPVMTFYGEKKELTRIPQKTMGMMYQKDGSRYLYSDWSTAKEVRVK